MPSPKIQYLSDKQFKGIRVSYNDSSNVILILDIEYYMKDDDNKDTFLNLCHQACKTARKSATFIYIAMSSLNTTLFNKLTKELKPRVIIGATEEVSRLLNIDDISYKLCSLQNNSMMVIPFRYWASDYYKGTNSLGNSLLGFTLRGLTAAVQGKNLIPDYEDPEVTFKYINTIELFDKMLSRLKKKDVISFDSEGTSLGKITCNLISLQFGIEKSDGSIISYFLPLHHRDTPWSSKDLSYIIKQLRNWMLNTTQEFVMHGGSYDCTQLMKLFDVEYLPINLYDTTAGEFLLDENRKSLRRICGVEGPYRLDYVEKYHGIKRGTTAINKEDRSRMASFSLEEIFDYACWDVVTLLGIRKRQIALSTHALYGFASETEFKNTVINQLGLMLKTYATMGHNGIQIDLNHLVTLSRKDGPFAVSMQDIYDKILSTKNGKKANEILLKKRGAFGGGLFGNNKVPVALELTKPEHRKTLFFDVMGLEPLRIGKNGSGSTDSAFQKAYAGRNIEVELFRQFNSNLKLKTAFADSLLDIVTHDADFKVDGRVRPGFSFLSVVSGRSSSFDPNGQQVPSRGPLAKTIKKNFTVRPGHVMLAADFSAHEVRVSGIVSKDEVICHTFEIALEAIRQFRLGPVPNDIKAALEKLELEIDIHIQNALVAYGKRIHKDDPLRGSVKNVVFSIIYGAMAKKIAKTTESGELQAAVDTIFKKERELVELRKDKDANRDKICEIKKLIDDKQEIMERPFEYYLEQAEDAFAKFGDKWHVMFEWMDKVKEDAAKTFLAPYPNGRIRHLWGYLSSDIWAHRAMDRRAVNSIIQGLAADIGMVAASEADRWVFEAKNRYNLPVDMLLLNIIHDAAYREVLFEQIPLAVYLTEHSMSTMPYNYFKKRFNFEFLVPLGYDVDMGISWDSLVEWKKRPEMMTELIATFGEKLGKTTKEIAKVNKDWNVIWDIRRRELEKNSPSYMYLKGDKIPEIANKLHMFCN